MRLLLTVSLLGAGCHLGLGLDFSTDATSVTATARGDGTTVVSICAGHRDLLSCDDAEPFTVSMGGLVVENDALDRQLFGSRRAYLHDDRPDSTIVVTRDRDGAALTVTLPAPFELSSPPAGSVVSRREGVVLRRTGSGGPVTWSATTTCDGSWDWRSGEAGDGTTTLGAGDLPSVQGAECQLELIVEQRRKGHVDAAFPDGSEIHAVQERTVNVRLVP